MEVAAHQQKMAHQQKTKEWNKEYFNACYKTPTRTFSVSEMVNEMVLLNSDITW